MAKSKLSAEAKAAVEEGNRIRKELTTPTKKTAPKKLAVAEQKEEADGQDKDGTSEVTPNVEDGVMKSEQTNLSETRNDEK